MTRQEGAEAKSLAACRNLEAISEECLVVGKGSESQRCQGWRCAGFHELVQLRLVKLATQSQKGVDRQASSHLKIASFGCLA